MIEKLKGFAENVASNVVASIILSVLVGFGAPCALIWSSVKSYVAKAENNAVPKIYWIIYIIGLAVALLCIIFTIIRIVKRANRPNFPKIQSDVRYESAVSELYFKNREEIACFREVKFEVICERMASISKQFNWTGTEYKGTSLEKSQGNYTLIDCQRKHPPHGYEIKFDSVKLRGEKVWYKTKTEVEDTNHDMQPFFSHMMKSPADSLELRVTAPIGLLKDVTYAVYADSMAEIIISESIPIQAKNIGNLETFSYKIDKPNLLYNYRLDWNFNK